MKEIGVITKEKHFEWKIKNFFDLTEDFCSPAFKVSNSTWNLEMWPNGKITQNCIGYVSLFLNQVDEGPSKSVDIAFGIKTSKHLSVANIKNTPWKSTIKEGWGWAKFIERAKLETEEESLAPSGILTIIVSLTVHGHVQCSDIDERKSKLIADMKDMFVSKKNTDVTIKVKEETFSAHRFILSARSPVLSAMFKNDMSEKETGFINISDCDPDAFHQFLLYLYSGELYSGECDCFHLYKIADKYDVPELKQVCVDFIYHNLSPENFCESYMFGHQFNENRLLANVQNFFNENFQKVVSLDSWESFMKENTSLANNLLKVMAPKVRIKK